jgi:DNA polymerase-3 subunit delta'
LSKLEAFLGNEEFKQAVGALLKAGRLPHALLLAAPDGCGRTFAARLLAADYLYPKGGPAADAVSRGASPELIVVQGEGKSGQISVAAVRAVRADVHLSSLSAGGRVVLLQDAHRMTTAAANALLKVLEEPPEGVVFILTVTGASAVPLTVQSRCTLYPLAPVAAAKCEEVLRRSLPLGAGACLPPLLAAVYGGRIGLCLRALRQEGRLDTLWDAISAAEAAAKADRYSLLKIFSRYEGRADGDRERREDLLSDMCDVLGASLGGGAAAGLPKAPPAVATVLLSPITETRLALRGNVAPKIAFAALCAQLQAVAGKMQ